MLCLASVTPLERPQHHARIQQCPLSQAALAQQSEAAEAATARQLAFIDRLLADKEGLARRCAEGERLLKVNK